MILCVLLYFTIYTYRKQICHPLWRISTKRMNTLPICLWRKSRCSGIVSVSIFPPLNFSNFLYYFHPCSVIVMFDLFLCYSALFRFSFFLLHYACQLMNNVMNNVILWDMLFYIQLLMNTWHVYSIGDKITTL